MDKLTAIARSRYTGYLLFLGAMFAKLMFLHSGLHAQNIDMNRMDRMIAAGSLMLLSCWTLWLPRRGQTAALLCLNLLLTGGIYADIVYYRYFQDFITIPVLMQAGQMGALGDSITALLRASDILLFADLLLILIYLTACLIWRLRRRDSFPRLNGYRRTRHHGNCSRSWSARMSAIFRRAGAGAAALILGFLLTFGPIHNYATTWAKDLFTGNWWSLAMYNVTGLIGFHAYDAYLYAQDHLGPQPKLTDEEADKMNTWFGQQSNSQSAEAARFGTYSGSNIIVVQAEAFMNFVIGRSVNGQEITPNLNKLMNDSTYYSHYYHQTSQGRTSDADFASNASLYPLVSGSVFVRYSDHQFDVLPSILKEHGYNTYAFHAYEGSFWNRQIMYNAMGYDHFYSKKDYRLDEPLGWSLGDKSFFRQSLDFLNTDRSGQSPFYAFFTTLSSHYPYSLPAGVQELDTGKWNDTIFGDYLQAVHYTDAAVGELIRELQQQGLWENTLFAFYGDHDNSIGETSYYEQFLGQSLTALDMHELMHQVPLLLHLPGATGSVIDEAPAGQLDLTPSLLHLLGISRSPYYLMGNDFFSGSERLVTLRSGAFADTQHVFIPGADGQFSSGTCYNRSSGDAENPDLCRPGFEESLNRLQISDNLIKYDALSLLKSRRNSP